MANPNLINGPNDIDIAINCANLSTGTNSYIPGATCPADSVRKIVNLTVVNYSTTTTAGYKINEYELGADHGTIFEGTLEPSQSVCLVDETRPMYFKQASELRGQALTANNCISVYCASEVYS
jgi:hypothetical protein